MTPLEAAREIAGADLHQLSDYSRDCPFCGGFLVGLWGESRPEDAINMSGYDHYAECPWLSMPRIVAALERLEAMQAAVNECGKILYGEAARG